MEARVIYQTRRRAPPPASSLLSLISRFAICIARLLCSRSVPPAENRKPVTKSRRAAANCFLPIFLDHRPVSFLSVRILSRDTPTYRAAREWRLRAWLTIRSFGFPCDFFDSTGGGGGEEPPSFLTILSTMMYESFRFCETLTRRGRF